MKQSLYITAGITTELHDVFVRYMIEHKEISELCVYMTCPGGNPFAGHNLYSFVKSLDIETTIHNVGTVDSAAVLFFLGFKNRFASENATFMVHQTKFSRDLLPSMYTRFDLLTALHELEAMEQRTEQLILKETKDRAKTDIDLEKVRHAIFHTTVSTAQQAFEVGLVDEVKQHSMPKDNLIYLTEDFISSLKRT